MQDRAKMRLIEGRTGLPGSMEDTRSGSDGNNPQRHQCMSQFLGGNAVLPGFGLHEVEVSGTASEGLGTGRVRKRRV